MKIIDRQNIKDAIRDYVKKRIEIARNTARAVESRIRTGEPLLGEISFAVGGLSTEFGEKTKKERIKALRETLSRISPRYNEFSQKRLIK